MWKWQKWNENQFLASIWQISHLSSKTTATCSSDQHVKIWDRDPATNTWKNTATWKSHSGSVWKVTWAHPEFGQIVATCSFDRTAVIWEEVRKMLNIHKNLNHWLWVLVWKVFLRGQHCIELFKCKYFWIFFVTFSAVQLFSLLPQMLLLIKLYKIT